MRYKKLLAATMSAVMILSGCNADKPAETSAVTEEVTTTITAEVTTVAATTTTSSTTASKTEKSENAKKYFVDCYERPFDNKALDMFEKAFYGSWKCTDTRGASIPETLVLTYAKSPFTFESWYYPCGIIETDEIFALTFINGGIGGCFVIEKTVPDVMYRISEYNCSDFVIDEHAYIYTDRSEYKAPTMPENGEISVFGWCWLENKYGEDFTRKFEEAYNEDYIDEDGRVWSVHGEAWLTAEKRIIISRTDNSVIIVLTYRDKEESESYSRGNSDVRPTERQFALVFEKSDSGEWSVTDYEPFNAPEDVKLFSVPMMFTNDKGNFSEAAGMWLSRYVYADGHTYRRFDTGGESIHAEHFAGWVFTDDDKEAAEIDAAFAPYCDENGLNVKLISSKREVQTYYLLENTSFEENYWKHTLRGDGYMHWKTYVVDDEWLVYLETDDSIGITFVGLARRDDIYRNIRRALDVLWEYNDKYPDMRVIFRTDMAEDKSYLDISANADELPEIEKLLTRSDVDMSECRLLTADEVRAEWLPVKCYAHYDGKYTESDLPANRLKAFTYSRGDDVYRLESFTGVEGVDGVLKYVESNCTAEEFEKLTDALTAHGIKPDAFETATAYADVFDIVQLPHDRDKEEGTFYRISDTVIIEELPPTQGKYRYNIWEYDDTHTEFRKAVKQFRIKPLVDNDFNKYYINSIEYIAEGYDPNNSPVPDGYELRVIADKQYWDGIMKYAAHEDMNYGAKKDSFVLVEESAAIIAD